MQIGPFLSRQERPPPKRPPTCWCPLEARASPAPPVRPNQSPDRGEPACEITPLSCSHWARDTLHPCLSSARPPPRVFYVECQWLLFGGKKNGRKTGKQLDACFIGFSGAVRTAVGAGHQPQLKPRLSFIPVSLPRFPGITDAVGKSDVHSCLSNHSPPPKAIFITPNNKVVGSLFEDPLGGFAHLCFSSIAPKTDQLCNIILLYSSILSNRLFVIYNYFPGKAKKKGFTF